MASFVISLICELFRHNNELCIGWTFSFRSEISRGHLHDESCGGKIPFDRLCKDLTKMNLSFCHPLTLVIVVHENDFVVDGLQDLPGVQLPSNLFRFPARISRYTFRKTRRDRLLFVADLVFFLLVTAHRPALFQPQYRGRVSRRQPARPLQFVCRPRPAPSMSSIGSPLRKLAAAKARDAYAIEFARICRSNTTRSLDRSF